MASDYGVRHVKECAAEILKKHPEFIEFIIEGYCVFFTQNSAQVPGAITEFALDDVEIRDIPEVKELYEFLTVDWDDRLEITGKNIRVMRDGAILTEGDAYAHMPTPKEGPRETK